MDKLSYIKSTNKLTQFTNFTQYTSTLNDRVEAIGPAASGPLEYHIDEANCSVLQTHSKVIEGNLLDQRPVLVGSNFNSHISINPYKIEDF